MIWKFLDWMSDYQIFEEESVITICYKHTPETE
jgi:hypothetical protein